MSKEQKTEALSLSWWYNEESLIATEFRRLYAKMRHLNPKKEITNLLITSATMNEGKSTAAALMAITICKYLNTPILLIDCDLRRPTIHEIFEVEQKKGFSDVAMGTESFRTALKDTFIPKLKVLTSGELTKNPSDIFNELNLKELFAEFRFYFDTIIVDCSPAIAVSDPLVLSPEMDGALLVVKAGKTPQELVKRASDLLKDAGIKIFGTILNNMDDVLPYYYSYKYGYQQYQTNMRKTKFSF